MPTGGDTVAGPAKPRPFEKENPMNTRTRLLTVILVTAALALPAAPAPASTPDTFGGHVRDCAQTMGFSGTHNPGMHHGAAGWDGEPCQ